MEYLNYASSSDEDVPPPAPEQLTDQEKICAAFAQLNKCATKTWKPENGYPSLNDAKNAANEIAANDWNGTKENGMQLRALLSFCIGFRVHLQYYTAEWEPAFLRQAREFPFFPLLPREASKSVPIFDRGTGSKPERLRSGFLQADLSLIV